MLIIGLTGSIGMGKSTTASMFRDEGIPVHDSDSVVHDLYRGAAVSKIEAAFPLTIVNGSVDRAKLGAEVIGNPDRMKLLESIVHPMVEKARSDFLEQNKRENRPIIVLDIPLLFEIGGEKDVHIVVVVSAPDHIQEHRVLQRAGMTKEKFDSIRAKQLPNSEKCRRAHIILDTSQSFPEARRQIKALLRSLAAAAN